MTKPNEVSQKKVNEIFREWGKLNHSQLLNVDQRGGRFSMEFVIDQSKQATSLLKKITKATIEKHPTGTVAFISYYSAEKIPISTLYRKYRADFLDPANQGQIDSEKIKVYIDELIKIIKEK
jgi:hypothetical protein